MSDKKKKSKVKTETGELSLFNFFVALTAIPTVLAIIYYGLIASDIYISETKFSIYSNEPEASPIDLGAITQLTAGNIKSSSLEQLLMAAEYIQSFDMLKKLDKDLNLKKIYSNKDIDFVARISATPSNQTFLEHYNKMVDIKVNREAFMISVKAKAFTSQDALKISEKINFYTEEFINKMLARVKTDTLLEAQIIIDKAEGKIKDTQNKLTEFRINNTMLDPLQELEAKLEYIKSLELRKASFMIEKGENKSLLSSSSIPMRSVKSKIKNIDNLISNAKGKILDFSSKNGDLLREYGMLALDEDFAKKEYKLALVNLEDTIKNQNMMSKYIVEILQPTTPDVATEPRRFQEILKVFALSFIFFGVLSLIISGVRDHIVR